MRVILLGHSSPWCLEVAIAAPGQSCPLVSVPTTLNTEQHTTNIWQDSDTQNCTRLGRRKCIFSLLHLSGPVYTAEHRWHYNLAWLENVTDVSVVEVRACGSQHHSICERERCLWYWNVTEILLLPSHWSAVLDHHLLLFCFSASWSDKCHLCIIFSSMISSW
jgi:hypothetical protein